MTVWHLSLDLSNEIDQITNLFPRKETFCLSSQIKRAADSVVLNIAEGGTGQSKAEFSRFLGIALRSAIEVVACLFIAVKRKYIDEKNFQKFYTAYEKLSKMITRLRSSLYHEP